MKTIFAAPAFLLCIALPTTAHGQTALTPRNSAALPVSAYGEILGWRCGDVAIIKSANGVEIFIGARVPARISITADGLSMNGRRCEVLRSMFRSPDTLLPAMAE